MLIGLKNKQQSLGSDPDKCPDVVNQNLHDSGGVGLATQWGEK